MTKLAVRKLLIDLSTPFDRHWNGGDAFSSTLFNALSMSFPAGEQFFLDSVRNGSKLLPAAQQTAMAEEIKGFIGQEATHRRIHQLMNDQLTKIGYTNLWEQRIIDRQKLLINIDLRHAVAITAATEHLTALFAHWLLNHPEILKNADPRLRTLWMWHASEESEHRSTAFDVYLAMNGNYEWRVRMMRWVAFYFLSDLTQQTLQHLWRDKQLFKVNIYKQGFRFLFGSQGLISSNYHAWRDYFKRDFHPSQHDDRLSQQWLKENTNLYSLVGKAS